MKPRPELLASPPAVDCWQCRHHFITHDPAFPYGCHAMQFKSRQLPAQEVLNASGAPCLMFQPRQKAGG